nr:hypothetical protein [Tanacetum cinerariifolium]GEZ88137.1 hypothetical protein [Tanacetum cinerariifolium]
MAAAAQNINNMTIRRVRSRKERKKPQGAKGKDKGKNKLAYDPKPKIPEPPKRDNMEKDYVYHHCKEGLRESKKLKHGALSLYMSNGMHVAIEAIGSFDLIIPSGLIIVLDNCHFAPFVTTGVVSISRLVNNDYIHTFTNYGISVSKDNVFYFNAIPRDGIYEIDMHNVYPNLSSMFNVRNKRAKHALDSSYLWHCRLGKMTRKPFPHQVERAKDLIVLIHTDVCGPFRSMSREGASYFITFTDDFSHYGYVYLMKYKHEVFETFNIFQNEVEKQLGKKIKAIRSDRGGEYLSHEFVNHIKSFVRSMMNLTPMPKSFWGYTLKSIARILNMVPTKKFEMMPYDIWHGKALELSYLRRGDGVASIKRRHRDLSGDGVRDLETASGRGRRKGDLESSTWRRHQDSKATPSR